MVDSSTALQKTTTGQTQQHGAIDHKLERGVSIARRGLLLHVFVCLGCLDFVCCDGDTDFGLALVLVQFCLELLC